MNERPAQAVRLLIAGARGLGGALFLTTGIVLGVIVVLRWVDPFTSAFMLRHHWLDDRPPPVHQWANLESISPWMQLAVIASEDQRFPTHPGIDLTAIRDALRDHQRGDELRGASTLSQQVAKNLFLWPGRSYLRKGLELGLTLLIEALWPKRRILEIYLNVAQFGPNHYGVAAASRHFFARPPSRLTPPQAALLAATLPNPRLLRAAEPSQYLRTRQQWILRQMRLLGGPTYLRSLR